MKGIYCAPDLPFWETVGWQIKQAAATFFLLVCFLIVLFGGYLFYDWKSKK